MRGMVRIPQSAGEALGRSAVRRIEAIAAIGEDEDSRDAWEFQEESEDAQYVSTVYGIVPSRSWSEYRSAQD